MEKSQNVFETFLGGVEQYTELPHLADSSGPKPL